MTIDDVDLNLVRVLDALLEEGSVAGAAARLHLSSPAVSRALGRLRRAFGDPLFVRAGRNLTPTARAVELAPAVRDTMDRLAALLTPPEDLDPAHLQRRFTVRADDAIIALVTLPLVREARRAAPGLWFDFLPDSPTTVEELRSGRLDLAIGVKRYDDPDIHHGTLLTDHFVAAVRRGHPLTAQTLTPARYARAEHVVVSPRARRVGPIDHALAARNLTRTNVLTVTSFLAAAHLVASTDLVGSLPRALVSALSTTLGIVGLEIPVRLPTFDVEQHWHRRADADPAHRVLRQLVTRASAELTAADG